MLAELDRLGTVAAVAAELHLTPPGVSMQLAALERELGLPLTERRGRGLALTAAGRTLAAHGSAVADLLSLAELEVAALRDGAVGTYRVGAFPSIARTVVADAWRTLRGDGGLSIRMELLELEPRASLPALAAGEVDIALTHAYSNMAESAGPGFVATLIAVEPVWLAVPDGDPAGTSGPADLHAFADHDWVVPHRQWTCYEMTERACGLAGFTPRSVAEASDFAVLLALVGAGAGVALVPELTVAEAPDGVRLLPLATPVVRNDYAVIRAASATDPGLARVRSLLAETAAGVLAERERTSARR
ncbi:LysR family transcriptional regulator [Leifsonia sp. McL0607]|uniref:LysR family transcriptional regulator n=1 Tax=Leifsonia sp. McL0607 TaxID=3415672 RepID=UPI003CF39D45